jgi:hypothetical protein
LPISKGPPSSAPRTYRYLPFAARPRDAGRRSDDRALVSGRAPYRDGGPGRLRLASPPLKSTQVFEPVFAEFELVSLLIGTASHGNSKMPSRDRAAEIRLNKHELAAFARQRRGFRELSRGNIGYSASKGTPRATDPVFGWHAVIRTARCRFQIDHHGRCVRDAARAPSTQDSNRSLSNANRSLKKHPAQHGN